MKKSSSILSFFLTVSVLVQSLCPLYASDAQDTVETINRAQQAQAATQAVENLENFQKTQKALDTIENLKRMNETLGRETYQKAMVAREKGDLASAEKLLRKAIEYESKAEYHFELANIYALYFDKFQDSKTNASTDVLLSSARRELEVAVMEDPGMIPARYNLGVVYKRQRQFEKAREEFRKILEMDPTQVSAKVQIGAVYEAQGFFDDAETAYKEAVEMDPYNPNTQSLIHDLKQHREVDYQERKANEASQRPFSGTGFTYAPGSRAAELANQPGNSSGGILSAAPLAGTWLLQEFMKRRSSKNQNE